MLVEIAGVFSILIPRRDFFSICPSGFYLSGKETYTNIMKGKNREYIFVLHSENIVLYSAF